MLKIAVHKVGENWENRDKPVVRVRPVSPEAIKDGSQDGVVLTTTVHDVGGIRPSRESKDAESLKVVLLPETTEEVDGLIRQLGELKSRMLKRERKQHTIFGG